MRKKRGHLAYQCESRKNENDDQEEDESKPPAKKAITTKLKWGTDIKKINKLNADNEKGEHYLFYS